MAVWECRSCDKIHNNGWECPRCGNDSLRRQDLDGVLG